jgi:hypothetical protein
LFPTGRATTSLIEAVQNSYAQQLGADMTRQSSPPDWRTRNLSRGGKKFTFACGRTRIYHPFSLTLLKATHTIYAGTDIPKDFSAAACS